MRNRAPMTPAPAIEALLAWRDALTLGQTDRAVAELAKLQRWATRPSEITEDQADDQAEDREPWQQKRKRLIQTRQSA